jgi:hypothetical protein
MQVVQSIVGREDQQAQQTRQPVSASNPPAEPPAHPFAPGGPLADHPAAPLVNRYIDTHGTMDPQAAALIQALFS